MATGYARGSAGGNTCPQCGFGSNAMLASMGMSPMMGAGYGPMAGAGFNPMMAGFNPMMAGFNPMMAGFNPMMAGFNPMMAGFNPMMAGFNPMYTGGGMYPSLPYTAGWGLGGLRTWGGTYSPQYLATGLPTDEEITEMVYDALDNDPLVPWDAEIGVDVNAGEVTLTGTVPNKRIKHAAGDDAWWIAGVTDVHNDVQVTGRQRAQGGEGTARGRTARTKTQQQQQQQK